MIATFKEEKFRDKKEKGIFWGCSLAHQTLSTEVSPFMAIIFPHHLVSTITAKYVSQPYSIRC